jgi:hypothetical protein
VDPLSKLIEIGPVFIIFPTIAYIVKISLEYTTRKRIIDKGLAGDQIKNLIGFSTPTYVPSSLKWGLVLVLVGLSVVIMDMVPDVSAETALGIMLIAAGAGMLIYYFYASSKAKEEKSNTP